MPTSRFAVSLLLVLLISSLAGAIAPSMGVESPGLDHLPWHTGGEAFLVTLLQHQRVVGAAASVLLVVLAVGQTMVEEGTWKPLAMRVGSYPVISFIGAFGAISLAS